MSNTPRDYSPGSASTPLAEVVMPEQPRRDGAMRTPGARSSRERLGRGPRAQPPQLTDRFHQREIRRRENVRAPQREEEIALRGPRANAMQRVERLGRFEVGQRAHRFEIERLADQ